MYCPKCGKKNDDNAKFCQECGFLMENISTILNKGPTMSVNDEKTPFIRQQENRRKPVFERNRKQMDKDKNELSVLSQHNHDDKSLQNPVFFSISAGKLAILSICSFGIYEIYWFYKNWRLERKRTHEAIMPFWRALFGVLFCYSLFRRIRDYAITIKLVPNFNAGWRAAFFILLSILWRLPDPFWLISTLTFLPLLGVQKQANLINKKVVPDIKEKSSLSGGEGAIIGIGVIFWIFILLG